MTFAKAGDTPSNNDRWYAKLIKKCPCVLNRGIFFSIGLHFWSTSSRSMDTSLQTHSDNLGYSDIGAQKKDVHTQHRYRTDTQNNYV